MELKTLHYFVEVVKQKSMHKAAAQLYVTQPSLSRAIQSLEEELSTQLLIRTNHGVELTAAGENVFYYAKSIQERMNSLYKIKEMSQMPVQTKLGVAVARVILDDSLMLRYKQKVESPDLEIQILESAVEEALNNVASLRADIGLIMVNTFQMSLLRKVAEIKELQLNEIRKSPVCVFMNRENPLMKQDTVQMSQLAQCVQIELPSDYFSDMNYSIQIGGTQISAIKHMIIMNNYHSIICMLKHSESFIFAGDWQKAEMVKGGIYCRPIEGVSGEMHLLWVKRKRDVLPDNVQDFLGLLLDNYR